MALPEDDALGRVQDRPAIGQAERLIEYELQQERERIERRIFGVLSRGEELDSAMAIQGWVQLHSLDRIYRRLVKREQEAQAAGQKLEGSM